MARKLHLDVDSASFSYLDINHNTHQIFINLSFKVFQGEVVAIVGPNGCGKTTLLSCIAGLFKLESGSIKLQSHIVKKPTKSCSLVFQKSLLIPWRTVYQNITYGLEIQSLSRQTQDKRANQLLNLLKIKEYKNFYPYQLSGGLQQKVNIARSLATDPRLVLMDEPFSSLDSQTRDIFQLELLKLWQKEHKTLLFVTHQIDEAIYLSDRVIVLTKKPTQVKAEIKINLPKPRPISIKLSPSFLKIQRYIWNLIISEVEPEKSKAVQ
ncbi:ABC transporter ATP-binding protein [Candidatus Daviesbacteria bacterium]|nr:ABC transporter ATP-binding protein [Candidatus Daviesbacteria bacterium]